MFLTKSSPQDNESFPFVVIGNKIDLEVHRKISTFDGQNFCQENGNMIFYESSAKNNINVENAFRELGAQAIRRKMEVDPFTGELMEDIQKTSKLQLEARKRMSR